MRIYITLILVAFLSYSFHLTSGNTIQGKIELSEIRASFLQKGNSYKGGSAADSKEKKRIDELNRPDRNIYISLHPEDFDPELPPTQNVQMTQRAKSFFPNIVAVTKGSTVQFVNEDEFYHNVYSLSSKSRFNIGRRATGNVYGQKVNKTGIIKLGCDIHPEMSAVILSLDTPYFTKIKDDGSYKIEGLPDGSYELRIYHPAIQKHTETIQFKGGEVIVKDIKLQAKA